MKRLISQVLLGGILLSGIPLGSSTVDAAVPLDTLTPDAAVESAEAAKIQSISIARTNLSEYNIYQADEASECLNFAAQELSSYIEQAAGIHLEIVRSADGQKVIELNVDETLEAEDAFAIKTSGGKLTITGGSERGCLYGVYEFLESYIGWRFLTVDCEVLMPEADTVEIADGIEDVQIPIFGDRGIYTYTAYYGYWNDAEEAQQDYWAKRRLNRENLPDRVGGAKIWSNGRTVHTLGDLAGGMSQQENPCLTDEKVYETVLANALKWLASDAKPADYISISQNDNMSVCSCENCKKVNAEEGSDSGTLVRFVNRIAEAIEEDYPDVLVHTLAYNATEAPPKLTKMRDNVMVQYCTMMNCFQHSLTDESCNENGGLWGYYFNNVDRAAKIKEWGSICDTLFIWDYGAYFSDYFAFFPTLDVLLENCRFYVENNVKGIFLNAEWRDIPEFDDLRTYLCSKVYWNPNMSEAEYDECINDFMKGYYGAGWEQIRAYYDFMEESSNKTGFCFCDANFTTFRLFRKMDIVLNEEELNAMFEEAKKAVSGDSVRLKRVEEVELTYQYVLLSSRYLADYIYGSEAVRADYQAKTKALYDKFAAGGYAYNLDQGMPEYDPTLSPIGWGRNPYEDAIKGNIVDLY